MSRTFYDECGADSNLPENNYSDCDTAGVFDPPGRILFGLGTFNAKAIASAPSGYRAEWNFMGGAGSTSDYALYWSELFNSCWPLELVWCLNNIKQVQLTKGVLSKTATEQRWWSVRDGSLSGPDAEQISQVFWSGATGRHLGNLTAPASATYDLYLQKWGGSGWQVAAQLEDAGSAPAGVWLEYDGTAGYYSWKVRSRSGSGDYQLGSSGPLGGGNPPLSVTLTATPVSGNAPLNDVSLTATMGQTSPWTTTYTFYCNRNDDGVNITLPYAAQYKHNPASSKTAVGVCDYSTAGTHTAKVIAERGAAAVEARKIITVGTPSSPVPEVTTLAATSVTQASATFNATVHPKNSPTTFWFDYGTTTSVSQSTPAQALAAATSPSAVSISQSGLSCGRQYFLRIRASNTAGPATPGIILSFTTDACGGSQSAQLVADPSFEAGNNAWWVANPAFYIKGTPTFPNPRTGTKYAFLSNLDGSRGNNLTGGMISPSVTIPADAEDADLRFYYSITSDETASIINDKVDVYLVRPGNQLNLITTISNLDENGTSYSLESTDLSSSFYGDTVQIFFAGSTNGSNPTVFRIDDVTLDVDLPTASAPTVTTESADQISASAARLNMTVDPNGADTTIWFDLEAGDSTPDDDTEHISIGAGSQPESVSISVFGLQCATLYYFRAQASNSVDADSGSVRSFTTLPCSGGPPHADTDPAENVTQTSARLTADVDPNGLTTQAWFAWGTTPSLGQETSHLSVGSGTGNVDFAQTLSGLACGTDYYFENHAENAAGHDDGATLSFTTDACDGGGSSAQGFFLDNRRQGCSGGLPAVLLWWTAPAGMDTVFTVRRTDGAYTATVNSSQGGMVHLVSSLLVPGETYGFYVEGTLNGSSVQTNVVTVPVISDECGLPVGVGDLPHLPLVWAGTPFCSDGTASVSVQWTAVGGATSYTLTRIDNVAAELTPYPNLTGTGMTDTGLIPGAVYEYMLDAVGSSGARLANRFTVFVPSGICGEPSTPGPFSAQVSAPVCDAGKGAVTLSWTPSSGAASKTHTYWSDDGFTYGSGTTFTGSSHYIDGIRPGALVKLMVQTEAASTPRQYRSVIMSQRIPLDICGAATLPPTVTTNAATYVQERQALLRASVVPNGDASTAYFDWGTSTNYGSTTPPRNAGEGYRSVSLGETLTGLSCGTTYHFRGVAVSARGRTDGVDQSFTTPACTVPVVSISATDATATENPMTSGTFLIQRTGSTVESLAVTYAVGGTATVGIDHTLAAGNVTFPAGSASQTLTVFPLDDSLVESTETVVVTLQPQGQYVVGSPSSATVTIASDEVPGGGCGRILVNQPRDQIGGCDASDTGLQGRIAENFRLTDRRDVSCLEVLGYYWPGNNPPQSSVFDVVFHQVASNGTPGAVVREDRGVQAQRQKTGNMTGDMEEWRFTIELTSPVDLAAGDYFVEVAGAAGTGGSFCWSEGQLDPVAGLGGLAFRNTGQWSLGSWDLAFKVFERSASEASDFYTLTPCRVVDTRLSQSPLLSGTVRSFQMAEICGISATAEAVAVNVTAINATQAGYLTLFPAGQGVPGTSTLNFQSGKVRANNAILPLSADGRIAVFPGLPAAGQVDLVIDVTGYFDAGNPEPPTFAPKVDKPTGTEPLGLAVTDLDGDHRADIAVSIYDHGNGERLSILRNTGTAGHPDFDTPVDIPTGRGPEGVAAGDLNNDGKADLVTANAGHQTVTVFKNSSTPGTIAFELVLPLLGIVGTPHRVVIADFDKDGRPDLIVTSNSGRLVSVFHHASDPNTIAFDYRRDYGVADFLNDLAVADIDRDTRPEILIPRTDSGLLTIFQNSSSPGNVQAGALSPLAAGTAPVRGIAAGDLNNDLAVDVVVAAIGGVGVFENSSSPGVFNLLRTDLPTGANPDAVAIGDLNKDGLLDVAVANPSGNTVTVLHNTSEGSPIVLTPLDLPLATGLTPITLVLEDVDGDGWLDMVVANHEGNSISILLNTSGQQ